MEKGVIEKKIKKDDFCRVFVTVCNILNDWNLKTLISDLGPVSRRSRKAIAKS